VLAPTPFDLSTFRNALPLPSASQIITASHPQQQQQHHPQQQHSQHSQQQHLQPQQHHSQQHNNNNSALTSWATDFIHVAFVTPQVKPSADTTLTHQQDVATAVHVHPYQQGALPLYSRISRHDDNHSQYISIRSYSTVGYAI
jgi:hypothetical protein